MHYIMVACRIIASQTFVNSETREFPLVTSAMRSEKASVSGVPTSPDLLILLQLVSRFQMARRMRDTNWWCI